MSGGPAALAAACARDALHLYLHRALHTAAGLVDRQQRGRHTRALSASARDALRKRRARILLRHCLVCNVDTD